MSVADKIRVIGGIVLTNLIAGFLGVAIGGGIQSNLDAKKIADATDTGGYSNGYKAGKGWCARWPTDWDCLSEMEQVEARVYAKQKHVTDHCKP